ncbi:MAG TPA: hypothetical protein VD908_17780 [Cytophagales bacterium]|nr:hypothetical protein [Cytophagales bacterium]
MIKEINNLADIEQFIIELVEAGVNIHPDDDFTQYVNVETGENSFSQERGEEINFLMGQCFKVCDREKVDIYSFALEVFLSKTGLHNYIPLPSEESEHS